MVQVGDVGLNHVARVKFLYDLKGTIPLAQTERYTLVNGFLLEVHGHHHARQQDEHHDALHHDVPANLVSPDALEHRPVVVAKTRLKMVNEQRSNAANEQTKRDINEPVNAEVENGEDEQQGVEQHEEMVGPVSPRPERATLFLNVEVIQHQNSERNGDVQAWDGVVQRVVEGVEHGVPPLVIEQGIHARNPR